MCHSQIWILPSFSVAEQLSDIYDLWKHGGAGERLVVFTQWSWENCTPFVMSWIRKVYKNQLKFNTTHKEMWYTTKCPYINNDGAIYTFKAIHHFYISMSWTNWDSGWLIGTVEIFRDLTTSTSLTWPAQWARHVLGQLNAVLQPDEERWTLCL